MNEEILNPAGSVNQHLVYEPLGDYRYLYRLTYGKKIKRGIAVAEKSKDEKNWILTVDDIKYVFRGKPLQNILFRIPPKEKIDLWLAGKYDVKSGQEIFGMHDKFFRIFLDLPLEYYYLIPPLTSLESWIVDALITVFYLSIVGAFGGGKTVTNEALAFMFKHGYAFGDISHAGIARFIHREKLNITIDEVDVKGLTDTEGYQVLRQGYRRGSPYARINKQTMETEVFDVFGVKAFSFHSDIEKALKTRTLLINIGETNDKKLPILNMFKGDLSSYFFDETFFWYMENIQRIKQNLSVHNFGNFGNIENIGNIEDARKQLFNLHTKDLKSEELEFLEMFRGRNIELGFIALQVCKAFGINELESLITMFKDKEESEGEYDQSAHIQILRDLLVEKYQEGKKRKKRVLCFK